MLHPNISLRALTSVYACRYVRGVSNWNFNMEDLKVWAHRLRSQRVLHA